MPAELEPLLGAFRSPLWLGRNRFRNGGSPSASSGLQGTGYADLPFETPTDVLSGMTRSAIHGNLPLAQEVSGSLLSLVNAGRERRHTASGAGSCFRSSCARRCARIARSCSTRSSRRRADRRQAAGPGGRPRQGRYDLEEIVKGLPIPASTPAASRISTSRGGSSH